MEEAAPGLEAVGGESQTRPARKASPGDSPRLGRHRMRIPVLACMEGELQRQVPDQAGMESESWRQVLDWRPVRETGTGLEASMGIYAVQKDSLLEVQTKLIVDQGLGRNKISVNKTSIMGKVTELKCAKSPGPD
eukprot:g31403.t1